MKSIVLVSVLFLSASACAMEHSLKVFEKKQQELNAALGIAAQTGNLADTIRLIEEGADPIKPNTEVDSTPLFKAAYWGHLDVVTYLVGCGALINELDQSFGISPFHVACQQGRLKVVEFLAHNGADIHLLDKRGNNALYLAEKRAHDAITKFIYKFDEEQHNKKKQESKKVKFCGVEETI